MADDYDYKHLFHVLTRRYGVVEPEALLKVLCPLHVPLASVDRTVFKVPGQSHWRASFTAEITPEAREVLQPGRTGKLVPVAHLDGAPWREIAKGRIYELDPAHGVALGEIYVGSTKGALEEALASLSDEDLLEIDQYGAAAKVLSALAESTLATILADQGLGSCSSPAC